MQIITTHVGADFDGLAAMLAARRLFPGARFFFPGAREASVRRMLDAGLVELEELKRRDIDPDRIERVILCDTRQRSRLDVVGEWLAARPEIEVVVFDHHPDTADDVVSRGGRVDASVGALSTLMLEELTARGLEPSPMERDALLLGIYEDTGSLTYATTSPRDLQAVARLLAAGSDLAVVRRFAARSLDVERLEILHRLIESLEIRRPHGHRVGLGSVELEQHVEELAPLVSRCLELFDLRVFVALFVESERIAVIARSDLPGFDAGDFLRALCGGGGHATAAAGGLRGVTLVEARERIAALLDERLPPGLRAAEVMVREVRTLQEHGTVAQAKSELNAWRLNAAPVRDAAGGVVGVVTRQALDAALQHGLAASPVGNVTEREPHWVAADALVADLAVRLAGPGPRLLLVGDSAARRLDGVVSRGSVLRALHGEVASAAEPAERRAREHREVRHPAAALLARGLSPQVQAQLQVVADEAQRTATEVCLVGGMVRDMLLERPVRDIDLVVVGDGAAFARRCAERLGGRVRVHDAFLTAVLALPDGGSMDFASARSEFYRAPAALPEVQTSALRQDLYRRDFTVNTLAIRLGPQSKPELIDFFGGRRDLEQKTLRLLHALSLIDDPTRAFRAVRLELRLGFKISRETLRLLAVAQSEGAFERLSGGRLRAELLAMLEDPSTALAALERLDELRLLQFAAPGLTWSQSLRARLADTVAALDWYRIEAPAAEPVAAGEVLLAALAWEIPPQGAEELADRLDLAGALRERVVGGGGRRDAAARLAGVRRLSEAAKLLAPYAAADLILLLGRTGDDAREWIRRDLREARTMELVVRGRDLLDAGLPAGPALGRALEATRAARLDGELRAADELAFAVREAQREMKRATGVAE
jgi:tRNA nucleotidyltransferase (CCA-adding enzyme)